MTDQANTTVSDERLADLAQAFKTWVQSGRSGAPDLDRDVAAALTELSARRAATPPYSRPQENGSADARRATADVTEATAWASCPGCNGTGDQGGNPSYGACDDCGGSGKIGTIAAINPPMGR